MSRLLVAGLSLVLLLSACSADRVGEPAVRRHVPAGGERDDTSTSRGSIAEHFSPPQRYPGPTWTKGGRPVGGRELNSIAGPDHCDWQSAVIMHLGWPLGTVSRSSAEIRQFIRDPDGVIGFGIRDKLAIGADLPDDARDTGYRNGELELWLSPSEPEAAYLRAGDDVERWPRADPIVACS
jgi:hypothetical protein